jgi:hypothetical protein
VEQPTVTDWRLAGATAAGVVLFLTVLLAVAALLPRPKPKPPDVPAQAPIARAILRPRPAPTRAADVAVEDSPAPEEEEIPPLAPCPVRIASALRTVVSLPEQLPPPAPLPEVVIEAMPPQKVVAEQKPVHSSEAEPVSKSFKRRNFMGEEYLAEALRLSVHEIDLDKVAGTTTKLLDRSKTATAEKVQTVLDLLPDRLDLSGLPVRREPDCRLEVGVARKRETYSRAVRLALERLEELEHEWSREGRLNYLERHLSTHQLDVRTRRRGSPQSVAPEDWRSGEVVAPLVQILQGEDQLPRLLLVRLLSRVKDPVASVALARLAIFDLSEEVREWAVRALPSRPRTDYRPVLLDGLRYPWVPVADHAAEALVALGDQKAIPSLVDLLDKPDPSAPVLTEGRKMVVPELVCVNHLRNCALCHAPSHDREDPIRGPVPTPGQRVRMGLVYYDRMDDRVVRADVTYLRQDFSALQPVRDPGVWPANQRYDYLIRLRELTAQELARQRSAPKPDAVRAASYPQREAVLFALRELAGRDAGNSAAEWRTALGQNKPRAER